MKRTDKYKDSYKYDEQYRKRNRQSADGLRVMSDAKVKKHTIVAIHVIVMTIRDIVMTTVDIRMIMIIVRIIADVMMNTMKMVIDTITIVTLDASNS